MSRVARNATVDAVRCMAAFGVVMIHLTPSTPAAEKISSTLILLCVPFFLIASLYFFLDKLERSLPSFHFQTLRLGRLLMPYIFWTLVYWGLRLIKYRMTHTPHDIHFVQALFYGGTGVQMFFIPLLFFFQMMMLGVRLLATGRSFGLIGAACLAGSLLFGAYGDFTGAFGFNHALLQAFDYLAMAALLYQTQRTAWGRRLNPIIGTVLVVLIACSPSGGYSLPISQVLLAPLAGYGLTGIALNIPFVATSRFAVGILSMSYGIYLAHFVFIQGLQFIIARLHLFPGPYDVLQKMALAGGVYVCCITTILLVRSSQRAANIVLGESARRVP